MSVIDALSRPVVKGPTIGSEAVGDSAFARSADPDHSRPGRHKRSRRSAAPWDSWWLMGGRAGMVLRAEAQLAARQNGSDRSSGGTNYS